MEVRQRSRLSHFAVIFFVIMARDQANRDPAGRELDRGVGANPGYSACGFCGVVSRFVLFCSRLSSVWVHPFLLILARDIRLQRRFGLSLI
jgi:hypothetical protein